jgi:hypothetical protein
VVVFGAIAGAIVAAALDRLRLGTSGALLSSEWFGSSVERTAKLHPLWRVLGWWTDAVWKKAEHWVVDDLKKRSGWASWVPTRRLRDVTVQ